MEILRKDGFARTDRGRESRSLTYLSSLDGFRAVSVLGVVAYHAEPDLVSGGFLGVDVFFVISGFLITSLLLREKRSERRIDLRRFWRRRARRLGPALLTVLTVVAVAGWMWTPSDQLGRLRGDGLATLGYVMNWRLIAEGDSYFETFVTASPLRHMWSLAIEEQFYLLWPVVVAVVLARRSKLLAPVIIAAGTVSVLAMSWLDADLSRLYYGTDTRLHVIMVGCLLAVATDRRPDWVRHLSGSRAVALVGVALVVVSMLVVNDDDARFYPTGFVLFALLSAVVIAGCARFGDLPVLSNRTLVAVGKRSYGLYLWHWPVQVYLTDDRLGLGHGPSTVVRLSLMAVLTAFSYALIEQPVRRSHAPLPRWWPLLPVGVAVVIVVATFGATTGEFADAGEPADVMTFEPEPVSPAPGDGAADPSVGSSPGSVLILGDSVAVSLGDELAQAFANRGVAATLSTHIGCGVADGIAVSNEGRVRDYAKPCPDNVVRQEELVRQLDPDVVFVMAHTDSFPRQLDDGSILDPLDNEAGVVELMSKAADRLSAEGAIVAFVLPADVIVEGDTYTNRRFAVYRRALHQIADSRDDVILVDVEGIVCPDQDCTGDFEGVELRPDGVHYTDQSAPLVVRPIVDQTLKAVASR